MALLSINKGKSGAANAALEALLRDDKGLSQIAVKSQKTKEVAMYAAETLLLFGYTVKACEAYACTVGQSTNGKYAGDYDSFFRILRGALPAGCLKTQVEVVCKAPEIPLQGSWTTSAHTQKSHCAWQLSDPHGEFVSNHAVDVTFTYCRKER